MDRLPLIDDDRIQVDCFPGAKIAQATYLLKHKTPVSPHVKVVILHFGLNDRSTADHTQVGKDMLELRRITFDTFPSAVVHVSMINISPVLCSKEWRNLNHLNSVIQGTPEHIPPIETGNLITTRDGVHWSPETGSVIWSAWKGYATF